MANTIEAEGLFSISYTSTKLGNLATGFSMILSGPKGSLSNKKIVKVSTGDDTGQWGSDSGVILSEGRRISRSYEGDSVVVVDPMYQLFQKLVFFHTEGNLSFLKAAKGAGSFISLTSPEANEAIYKHLATGDIEKFIEVTTEASKSVNIDYSKVGESPIINALSGNTAFNIRGNTINAASKALSDGMIMSVGDIFSKFVSPLGLELYWNGKDGYSLEPPRLSANDTSPVATITRDDIVELRMNTDPYNVPDVVIPTSVYRKSLGQGNYDLFISKSLEAGVLAGLGSKNLKVSTFDMPNFLISPVAAAVRSTESISYDSYESGMPVIGGTQETADDIARFYGSHARKSGLYAQKTGECIMMLKPSITHAYSWYIIDGMKCFVSDIRHELTRSSAVTILTIAGVDDPTIKTSSSSGGGSAGSDVAIEESFIADLRSASADETNATLRKVQKGENNTGNGSGKRTEKDMANTFSDPNDDDDSIKDTPISEITAFSAGGEQLW